jgi:TPR repeat protein
LAHAHAEGIGVDPSPEKAAALLQKAAEAGLPEAKYRLGLMYKSGVGVSADLNKAIELISSAQESGYPLAAVALSSMTMPSTTGSIDDSTKASGGANEGAVK